jgi:hypothetical protein
MRLRTTSRRDPPVPASAIGNAELLAPSPDPFDGAVFTTQRPGEQKDLFVGDRGGAAVKGTPELGGPPSRG